MNWQPCYDVECAWDDFKCQWDSQKQMYGRMWFESRDLKLLANRYGPTCTLENGGYRAALYTSHAMALIVIITFLGAVLVAKKWLAPATRPSQDCPVHLSSSLSSLPSTSNGPYPYAQEQEEVVFRVVAPDSTPVVVSSIKDTLSSMVEAVQGLPASVAHKYHYCLEIEASYGRDLLADNSLQSSLSKAAIEFRAVRANNHDHVSSYSNCRIVFLPCGAR